MMDSYPISASSLQKHYLIDGHQLERQYKEHLSEFEAWSSPGGAGELADKRLVFPENVGPRLAIAETSTSDGELYTVVTNRDKHGRKGCLVGIIRGTKAEEVIEALKLIDAGKRDAVEEVTLDLSPSMNLISRTCFRKAKLVPDRFHVQRLAIDAVQEIRISLRWEAIADENEAVDEAKKEGKEYIPERFENGDTRRALLARSRYLIFKSRDKWTPSQKERAKILFREYPTIQVAYELADELRRIYSKSTSPGTARAKLALWYNHVDKAGFKSFNTIAETVRNHYNNILNYFENKATNAAAESFNAKIKAFRAQLRGIKDIKYFIFRLQKIYA